MEQWTLGVPLNLGDGGLSSDAHDTEPSWTDERPDIEPAESHSYPDQVKDRAIIDQIQPIFN